MSQERVSDEKIELYNSYCVEEVVEAINRRTDLLLNFILFILGASIMSSFAPPEIVGFLVVIISGLQTVFKYGEKANAGKAQKLKYAEIIDVCNSLTDAELSQKLAETRKSDSHASSTAHVLGYKKACIKVGERNDILLTAWQRTVALFCGIGPLSTQIFPQG